MNRAQSGMVKHGVRIAHIPKAQRKPDPARKLDAIGPPHQTVIMYGDDVKANIKPRFFNDEVSAIKIDRQ
jgi:hypothetical protein